MERDPKYWIRVLKTFQEVVTLPNVVVFSDPIPNTSGSYSTQFIVGEVLGFATKESLFRFLQEVSAHDGAVEVIQYDSG